MAPPVSGLLPAGDLGSLRPTSGSRHQQTIPTPSTLRGPRGPGVVSGPQNSVEEDFRPQRPLPVVVTRRPSGSRQSVADGPECHTHLVSFVAEVPRRTGDDKSGVQDLSARNARVETGGKHHRLPCLDPRLHHTCGSADIKGKLVPESIRRFLCLGIYV